MGKKTTIGPVPGPKETQSSEKESGEEGLNNKKLNQYTARRASTRIRHRGTNLTKDRYTENHKIPLKNL